MASHQGLGRFFCCRLRKVSRGGEGGIETHSPAHSRPSATSGSRKDAKEVDVLGSSEQEVEVWESLMRAYDESESSLLDTLASGQEQEQRGQELFSVHDVFALRNDPIPFLSHKDPTLSRLAAQRSHILAMAERINKRPVGDEPSTGQTGDGNSKEAVTIVPFTAAAAASSSAAPSASGSRFSVRVSQTWANNLAAVMPVQGSFRASLHERNLLRTKPKWPEWLVDESYRVVKRNEYGQHFERTLKLTEFHILMASDKAGVTKAYPYSDVSAVNCVLLPLGEEHLLLSFATKAAAPRLFVFYSPVVQLISQQIATRCQVRQSLLRAEEDLKASLQLLRGAAKSSSSSSSDGSSSSSSRTRSSNRSSKGGGEGGIGSTGIPYSAAALASIMASISLSISQQAAAAAAGPRGAGSRPAGETDGSGGVVAFARGLLDRVMPARRERGMEAAPTVSVSPPAVQYKRRSTRVDRASTASSIGDPASTSGAGQGLTAHEALALAQRLLVVDKTAWPGDRALVDTVRSLLHDSSKPEGNTRRHFIEGFAEPLPSAEGGDDEDEGAGAGAGEGAEACREVRLWVEGMHEYLLVKRGATLGLGIASSAEAVALAVHDAAPRAEPDPDPDPDAAALLRLQSFTETTLLLMSYLVYCCVEESVCTALLPRLVATLPSSRPGGAAREAALTRKLTQLGARTQRQWGIPPLQTSLLEYRNACFELRGLEQYPTPSKRLAAVVACAHAIFAEYSTQARAQLAAAAAAGTAPGELPALGADDLVPIFIFVLCRAGLQTPLRNQELLWALCHPEQLHGEAGYYLTVYESAVAYVEALEDP